jgi:mRNA cleavage and polyadenylation factor CLP1 P-loop
LCRFFPHVCIIGMASTITVPKFYDLEPGRVLQLQIKSLVTITVTSGSAEVLGIPWRENIRMSFENRFLSILSSDKAPCTLRIEGQVERLHLSDQADSLSSLLLLLQHYVFSSKSNLLFVNSQAATKTMWNYLCRNEKSPLLVDLDVDQNMLCIPGSIGVTPCLGPFAIDEVALRLRNPYVLFYGSIDIETSPDYFLHLCSKLSHVAKERMNAFSGTSGMVVNLNTSNEKVIQAIIEMFDIDYMFSTEDIVHLQTSVKKETRIITLPTHKLSFLPDKEVAKEHKLQRSCLLKQYFFGTASEEGKLKTYQHTVNFDTRCIRKGLLSPSLTALPLSKQALKLWHDEVLDLRSDELLHYVVAIPRSHDSNDILALGWISACEPNSLTICTTFADPIPKDVVLLCGYIKFSC